MAERGAAAGGEDEGPDEPVCSRTNWVKASPALLKALREHLAGTELEGQVKDWTSNQR